MILFNDESKEDKKNKKEQEQIKKFMEKYQLEDLSDKDAVILKNIMNDLIDTGLINDGMSLPFASGLEQAKLNYLSALVEQNWLIFRKLDEISKKLDK